MKSFVVGNKGDVCSNAWLLSKGFCIVSHSENFALWSGPREDSTIQHIGEFSRRGYRRVFESCFVVEPEHSNLRHEAIQLLFLEIAGDTYKATIDLQSNVGCYDSLYLGAKDAGLAHIGKVLDFGCGPGTVLASSLYRQADLLIGFDFVDENRIHARAMGLEVLEPLEVLNLAPGYFDLIVCCYVLHYKSVESAILATLFDSLRVGGVWAANFHKSEGISWFLESLNNQPFIEVEIKPSVFGELMYLKKVGGK